MRSNTRGSGGSLHPCSPPPSGCWYEDPNYFIADFWTVHIVEVVLRRIISIAAAKATAQHPEPDSVIMVLNSCMLVLYN